MPGKLPISFLEKLLSKYTGVNDPSVILPARIGEDSAAISLDDNMVLVVHTNPITAASSLIGWLSIHVAANDVASTGVRPRWFTTTILLPEGCSKDTVDRIMREMHDALCELNATLIGGHTEYTGGIDRPITSTTAIGIASREQIVTTGGCKPGDVLIMTKTAGIEGTSVLASDFKDTLLRLGVSENELSRAVSFIKRISVVPEALALSENRLATAMHDATEGGIIAAALEMALASKTRIILYRDKVPVDPLTLKITRALGIDPLKMLSSGTLLATVPSSKLDELENVMSKVGVKYAVIGRVSEGDSGLVVRSGASEEIVSELPLDEIIKLTTLDNKRGE